MNRRDFGKLAVAAAIGAVCPVPAPVKPQVMLILPPRPTPYTGMHFDPMPGDQWYECDYDRRLGGMWISGLTTQMIRATDRIGDEEKYCKLP